MVDGFSARYGDLLYGSYDCVDRIVLNAYYPLGHNPGGFRTWWRRLHGDDAQLDNAHLIRMAGRFDRRVRASAGAHGIDPGDRLQARGTQAQDRRGVPGHPRGGPPCWKPFTGEKTSQKGDGGLPHRETAMWLTGVGFRCRGRRLIRASVARSCSADGPLLSTSSGGSSNSVTA